MSTPPTHEPADRDEERAAHRADSVPEESEAGADDPKKQAEAVLADSDKRLEDPSGTRNESTQTPGEE
ncbi:hypothetical protein [uncultured Nocardioides sp.]|uniref:hypothetical protein n=1 Tax=uncultured Nocardioides sp. TaxID=198441 RepID=UPI0026302802|nr:hypothetical protein [uncultured Nocardioides sp.]